MQVLMCANLLRMDRFTKTSLLLMSTVIFWIWQTASPSFDTTLPSIDIGRNGLSIPVAEIMCQYVGIPMAGFAYSLYSVVSNGNTSFTINLLFAVLLYIVACASGIHLACVILQNNMTKEDPIWPLVDFVHEIWSHNHFQFAIFALFIFVMWIEKSCTFENFRKAKVASSKSQGRAQKQSIAKWLFVAWMKWLWPVTMGLYFSIFAARTETKPITFLFYVCILVLAFIVYNNFSVSLSAFGRLLESEMIVFGSFTKMTLIGLPLLWFDFGN